jgi:hypothetical protein
MKIIKDTIEISELKELTQKMYENLVKAVIDIKKEIMAVDAPMHVDLEQFLIEKENCEPKNLWGINFHPEFEGEKFVEFDSMINLKPGLGNRSRGVADEKVRNKIIKTVDKLVKK